MSSASETSVEFKLAGVVGGVRIVIFPVIFIAAVETLLLVWSGLGGPSLKSVIILGFLGAAIVSVWALGMLLQGRGSIKMSPAGLRIEALSGTNTFRWEDIADVTVVEPSSVIVLVLSRPWRIALHPLRFGGTDVLGIPTNRKTFRFQVEDSEGFLSAAHSFMGEPLDVARP